MGKKTPPLSPEERRLAKSDFYGRKPEDRRNFPVPDIEKREHDAIKDAIEESIKDEAVRKKAAEKADRLETAKVNADFQKAVRKAGQMNRQNQKKQQAMDSTRAVEGDVRKSSREIEDAKLPALERQDTERINNTSKAKSAKQNAKESDAFDSLLKGDATKAVDILKEASRPKAPSRDNADDMQGRRTKASKAASRPKAPPREDNEEMQGRRGKGKHSNKVLEDRQSQDRSAGRGPK